MSTWWRHRSRDQEIKATLEVKENQSDETKRELTDLVLRLQSNVDQLEETLRSIEEKGICDHD